MKSRISILSHIVFTVTVTLININFLAQSSFGSESNLIRVTPQTIMNDFSENKFAAEKKYIFGTRMLVDGKIGSIDSDNILLSISGFNIGGVRAYPRKIDKDFLIKLDIGMEVTLECTYNKNNRSAGPFLFDDCDNISVKDTSKLVEKLDIPKEYSEVNIKKYREDRSNVFRADAKYLNKRFVFKGELSNIHAMRGGAAELTIGSFQSNIRANIPPGQEDILSELKKGETVTVLCLVTKKDALGAIYASLEDCKVYKGDKTINPDDFAPSPADAPASRSADDIPPGRIKISGVVSCGIGRYATCSIGEYDFIQELNGKLLNVCENNEPCEVIAKVDSQNRVIAIDSAKKVDKSTNILKTVNTSGYFRGCQEDEDPDAPADALIVRFFDSKTSQELSLPIDKEKFDPRELCARLSQRKNKPVSFTYKIIEYYHEGGGGKAQANILESVNY